MKSKMRTNINVKEFLGDTNKKVKICSDNDKIFARSHVKSLARIDCFHDPIMQYVLGGSLHKNNTIYLPLGLYHASVNWLSIVLM